MKALWTTELAAFMLDFVLESFSLHPLGPFVEVSHPKQMFCQLLAEKVIVATQDTVGCMSPCCLAIRCALKLPTNTLFLETRCSNTPFMFYSISENMFRAVYIHVENITCNITCSDKALLTHTMYNFGQFDVQNVANILKKRE